MKLNTPKLVKLFVPLAFIMTVSAGLVYIAVQQNFRMNANDPQIQIAEDFSAQLSAGQTLSPFNPSYDVDMAKTLSPFILAYDDTGKIITGSGKLDGQSPVMPAGVLDYTRKVGEDRITWQPQTGLRFALVITRYGGPNPGFIVVGRSLEEVEQRVSQLGLQVLGAWFAGLVGLLIILIGGEIVLPKYFA